MVATRASLFRADLKVCFTHFTCVVRLFVSHCCAVFLVYSTYMFKKKSFYFSSWHFFPSLFEFFSAPFHVILSLNIQFLTRHPFFFSFPLLFPFIPSFPCMYFLPPLPVLLMYYTQLFLCLFQHLVNLNPFFSNLVTYFSGNV